jgi:hypothetical protein
MAKSSYVWSGSEWVPVASAVPQSHQRGVVDSSSTSYTLGVNDTGKAIVFSSSSSVSLTIPDDSTYEFSIGQTFVVVQNGTGEVSITTEDVADLNSSVATGTVALNGQYSVATLMKIDADSWVVYGDIVSP